MPSGILIRAVEFRCPSVLNIFSFSIPVAYTAREFLGFQAVNVNLTVAKHNIFMQAIGK